MSLEDHLSGEMQRQDVLALKKALRDREMELTKADDLRQAVEDELEDAYKEIDRLKQLLDEAEMKAEEAIYDLTEVETAKVRLKSKLYELQEEMDLNEISVFKDERLTVDNNKEIEINLDGESPRKKLISGVIFGFILALVVLETMFVITGEDEIISRFGLLFDIDFSEISLPSWHLEEPSLRDNK